MTHPVELHVSQILQSLRPDRFSEPLVQDVHVVPDVFFGWDETGGSVTGTVSSEPGALLTIETQVSGTPSWVSLNIALGEDNFTEGEVLGLVIEAEGPEDQAFSFFLRSARAQGAPADTEIADRLVTTGAVNVTTLLHRIDAQDGVAWQPGFHMLVMRLPAHDTRLVIRDMRLFVVPAARGLRPEPQGLSG